MDRNVWNEVLSIGGARNEVVYTPSKWFCPKCNKGSLSFVKDSLSKREPDYAKVEKLSEHWSPHDDFRRASFWLKCNESACGEYVAATGFTYWDEVYSEEYNAELNEFFSVQSICPPPSIITIPSKAPKSVREEIRASFQLYWVDKGACVNRLRVSLERLLDDLKVPTKFKTANGKFKELKLHGRIEKSSFNSASVKDFLMAVKWVGNEGSHEGHVDHEVLLDTYELYEAALDEIYVKKSITLTNKAKVLIKTKGKKSSVKKSAKKN